MTSQEKNNRKPAGTSLLLQPPRSGFSWSDGSENVFLMPAVPQTLSEIDLTNTSENPKVGNIIPSEDKQEIFPRSATYEHPAVIPSSLSQLNQPLGVRRTTSSTSGSLREGSPSAVGSNIMPNQSSAIPGTTGVFMSNQNSSPSTYFSSNFSNVGSSASSSAPLPPPSSSNISYDQSNIHTGDAMNSQLNIDQSASYLAQMPSPISEYNPSSYPNKNTERGSHSNSTYAAGYGASTPSVLQPLYTPIEPHWFYKKTIEKRDVWFPFSVIDSLNLEEKFKGDLVNTVIATDGGRYDVYVGERLKKAVYWEEDALIVRRCTWFYKSDGPLRFTPYEEDFSSMLENLYRNCSTTGKWGQRLEMPGSEVVVMQSPHVILHYLPCNQPDDWVPTTDGKLTQRVVRRGVDEMVQVDDGESEKIDHLVFVVQGIGAVCDLRFRTVAECVDGFRDISNTLMKIHFKSAVDSGKIGRVEFLPVSWHGALHTDKTGVDRQMQGITLPSIPKLRHFTNDTLLDILYYTSPIYCQAILDTVGDQLNSIYDQFVSRNPNFNGKVSVAGHSLGSLILFDMLAHQTSLGNEMHTVINDEISPEVKNEISNDLICHSDDVLQEAIDKNATLETLFEYLGLQEYLNTFVEEKIDIEVLGTLDEEDFKKLGLPMGPRKKLLTHLKQPNNDHMSKILPNLGGTMNNLGSENVAEDVKSTSFVTVPDMNASPETSVFCTQSVTSDYPVSLKRNAFVPIKYPRLIFSPSCCFALGSPISMFLTVRGFNSISEDYQLPTCSSFFNIFHPYDPVAFRIETLIDHNFTAQPVVIPHHKGRKRLHIELREGLTRMGTDLKQKLLESLKYTWNSISDFAKAHSFPTATVEAEVDKIVQQQMDNAYEEESNVSASDACRDEDIQIGQLNSGRRIDYVLQEKPIESLNEYLFALTSHATYWDSEDTVLLILKEAYALENIFPSAPTPESGKIQLYNPAVITSLAPAAFIPQTLSNVSNQPMMGIPPPHPYRNQKFVGIPASETALSSASMVPSPNVPNLSASSQMSLESPAQSLSNTGQPIGPPPLRGFVKRSALNKH